MGEYQEPIANFQPYLYSAYGVCFVLLAAIIFWILFEKKNLQNLQQAAYQSKDTH